MQVSNVRELATAYKTPYAWPGGYPLYPITSDGGILCRKCFRSEYGSIADSVRDQDNTGWRVTNVEILWEGEEYCSHCSTQLESAYGEV
jgi:hypothetical protein